MATTSQAVEIAAGQLRLQGDLQVPQHARGMVLFAHGSGSSRKSPRNRFVADGLYAAGLGTLLMDLLTPEEERIDARTSHLRFDIPLLAQRLIGATDSLAAHPASQALRIGLFGASTGAAAALVAAAQRPSVAAVVSRGGRPDLAGEALALVRAPALLIVGGSDGQVIGLNRQAMARMTGVVELQIVPGATHLFEEPGTLEQVAELARKWFLKYLPADV